MKTLIITKIKFLKDKEIIENIFITYGFRNIQENIYIGELSTEDSDEIKKELEKNCQERDSILMIPICIGCFNNIYQLGLKVNLNEEKYVIL